MATIVANRSKPEALGFLWLEITGKCQLSCRHCYASSGPSGAQGTMTKMDWMQVLDQAADLGGSDVQIIGGEPTLHPDLPELVRHGLSLGFEVEVYSNLARRLSDRLWEVFELPGVRLATSYYAADAATHDGITTRSGSHRRTRDNIAEARRRGIPIRGGVVAISENQDVGAAVADLESLGVTNVKVDQLRQVGRGVRDLAPGVEQLCGRCADGKLAISPTGEVWPCVFSRWLSIGNVQRSTLRDIHDAATLARSKLRAAFAAQPANADECGPDTDGDPGGDKCDPDYKGCRPEEWE